MSDAISRRPPPDFESVEVVAVSDRGGRLTTLTLEGPGLVGFDVDGPAASLRLLLPRDGPTGRVEIPSWNGNEFRFDDGTRPPIRTLTPRRVDPVTGRVDVEVLRHGRGALSRWAEQAGSGAEVAVSGPGAGYAVPVGNPRYLLVGDESAIPAIDDLLEQLPGDAAIDVVVEVAEPAGRVELASHPGLTVSWHDLPAGSAPGTAMFDAVEALDTSGDLAIWAAGEAAAVQRLRRLLLTERGVPRSRTVIRGYWKHDRPLAGS